MCLFTVKGFVARARRRSPERRKWLDLAGCRPHVVPGTIAGILVRGVATPGRLRAE
jgi:hypothetical protein